VPYIVSQVGRKEAVSGKGEVLDHEVDRAVGVLDASNGDISNLRKHAISAIPSTKKAKNSKYIPYP
jgi:hypothetical protein